jgi:hypothetical protein
MIVWNHIVCDMESSPVGEGVLVPQDCRGLRADRDLNHTISQLINHFDRNFAIELEPRLKDPFLPLLRPNALSKVLAPVLERCPTHRKQRHYMPCHGNDRLRGSRILKAQRYASRFPTHEIIEQIFGSNNNGQKP